MMAASPKQPPSPVVVACGRCGGTGSIAHPRLTRIVWFLRNRPYSWYPTVTLAKVFCMSETNAANHMARLHAMDLVDRRGAGAGRSPYEWCATDHHAGGRDA